MSNYKHFSKMYILVSVIALLFHCALSVWHACVQNQVCGVKRKITKWKYLHGFLTFTDGEYTCQM